MNKIKIDKDDLIAAARKAGEIAKGAAEKASAVAKETADKTKEKISATSEAITEKLDQNGDGTVDITDIIVIALKTPGVYVNRTKFLQNEFQKKFEQSIIDNAVARTPALAGISSEEIDRIADDVIAYERLGVSGISAALGAPGGLAMAATVPADVIQFYCFTIRTALKLMYLYGFPEIDDDGDGLNLDSETINQLILCLGAMYGVAGANNAIKGLAKAFANGVEKKLLKTALTKGTIYPMVKGVAAWFGVKMTKNIFAHAIGKAIPVVGGIVGGGITFVTFKPCCQRLQNVLKDTILSNPKHKASEEENQFASDISNGTIVDVDFEVEVPEAQPFTEEELDSPLPL